MSLLTPEQRAAMEQVQAANAAAAASHGHAGRAGRSARRLTPPPPAAPPAPPSSTGDRRVAPHSARRSGDAIRSTRPIRAQRVGLVMSRGRGAPTARLPTARRCELEGGVDGQAARRLEPGDVRLRAEPGPLALGEGDVAPGVELDRRVGVSAPRRGRPTPRGSRSPRRPAASGRTARGAPAPRRCRPASNWACARARRSGRRGRPARRCSPSQVDGPGIAERRGRRQVAGQLGDLERADDAARVAQVDAAGRAGRDRRRRATSASRPSAISSASRRARTVGIARQRVGVEAARDRAQVEPGPAGEDRDAAARGRSRPGRRAACATKSATLNGWSGSTRSRPWWATRARSAGARLGRPDVEAAEDLARIGRDDRPPAARSR